MKKEIFSLRSNSEFIELVKLLKIMQIAQSGGQAKLMVEDGLVKVNGVQEFRKGNKLRVGDLIELESVQIEIQKS